MAGCHRAPFGKTVHHGDNESQPLAKPRWPLPRRVW